MKTTEELVQLERKVQAIYDQALRPLASRLAFELPGGQTEATGSPSVLFLGNHSSGKSSFINHLVGVDLQKTGLAPTDDGFTIITHGESQDEMDGQTVASHPKLVYHGLEKLGPAFLSRLKLKTLPHPLLQSITLIDSPGMIDAAGTANTRGYDFTASARYFAENADLILFFFDPDKPGTTGETISIFTETLLGLEYKLLIVLNKVDLFQNIRDFARTYGTLCWNLAKTIKTKDIPHIFNIYLPDRLRSAPGNGPSPIPLRDFDLSREEVITEIRRTPTRRADNLVSDLLNHSRRLLVHARVCQVAGSTYRRWRTRGWAAAAVTGLLTLALTWGTRHAESVKTPILIALAGALVVAALVLGTRYGLERLRESIVGRDRMDGFFAQAFHRELTLDQRADLRAIWDGVKPRVLKTIKVMGAAPLVGSYSARRSVRNLEQVIREDIPRLRREIA